MIKRILTVLAIFIVLVCIFSFFLPKNVIIKRSISINAIPESVFNTVNDLRSWQNWTAWAKRDPQMKVDYGVDENHNSFYTWKGNEEVGAGKMTIVKTTKFSAIETNVDFDGQGSGAGRWDFIPKDGETEVTWTFNADMSSPPIIGRIFGLLMDGMLGPDLESGLNDLKKYVEKQSTSLGMLYTIDITEEMVQAKPYIGIRDSSSLESKEIEGKMAAAYGNLIQYMSDNHHEMAGPPFTITEHYNKATNSTVFKAAIPTFDLLTDTPEEIIASTTYEGKTIKAVHNGPYDKLKNSYEQIMSYIYEKDLKINGHSWEVYMNDPAHTHPDSLTTHIYFPIK